MSPNIFFFCLFSEQSSTGLLVKLLENATFADEMLFSYCCAKDLNWTSPHVLSEFAHGSRMHSFRQFLEVGH